MNLEGLGFKIVAQYLKSVNVVNPNVPRILMERRPLPGVIVHCDVAAIKTNSPSLYEVDLVLGADALIEVKPDEKPDEDLKKDEQGRIVAFQCRLRYSALCDVTQKGDKASPLTQDQINALLLVDAPHYMFPHVRCLVARLTQDLGCPPLMLDPIDFASKFKEQALKKKDSANAMDYEKLDPSKLV